MSARSPESLGDLFAQALNAGNLEALMALYEADATLSPQPGQIATGSKAIREALSGFLAMKPTISMKSRVLAAAGDVALTSAKWELTGMGPDGDRLTMTGESIEVARRQRDGSWLFLIDTPWGLAEGQ